MNKFYATDPIDWVTALDKIYAKQSEQLQRWYDQQRTRDQQMVTKAETENITEVFKGLAGFSQTVSQAVKAGKVRESKKKAKELIEHEIARTEQIQDPDKIRESIERLVESNSLKLEFGEYKTMINGWKIHEKDKAYLISLHGGGLLKEREYLAHQATKYLESRFREFRSGTSEESAAANLKWQENENNPEARAAQLKEFALDSYKKLGFTNKEFIADNYWSEINRKTNTSKTLGNVKTSKTVLTQKSEKIDNDLDVAIGQLNNNPSAVTFAAQLHIKEGVDESRGITIEDSKENYTVRLERLASLGKFKEDELRLLREGQLPIPHAAGQTGEILLKPEQWKRIQESINTYNAGQVSLRNEGIKALGTNAIAALYEGNLTEKEAIKLKNSTLLTIKNTLGEDSEEYKALDDVDPTAQIKGAYENARAKYEEYFNGNDLGKVLQMEKDFDLETNGTVRAELQALVGQAKAALRAANLPDNWKDYLATIKDDMIADSGLDKTLDPDRAFSRNQERVQLFVARKKLKLLTSAYINGESADTADDLHQAWLTKHGWGIVNGGGLLSPNSEGVFERFKFFKDAKIKNTTKPSTYQLNNWTGGTNNTTNDFEGDIEAALNHPESYIDKEVSLGAFIEKVNKEGEVELFYSPELIAKSLALGKQPSYVLKKSIEALIANKKKYGDFLEKFDLENKVKLLDNAPDLKFKEMLERFGDKDLILQYNYQGGFTPKQSSRIAAFIKNEALIASDEEKAQQEKAQQEKVPTAEARLNFKEEFPQYMHLSGEELNQIIIKLKAKRKALQSN